MPGLVVSDLVEKAADIALRIQSTRVWYQL